MIRVNVTIDSSGEFVYIFFGGEICFVSYIFFVDFRLWGEAGQQALETAHVCLINANVVGTEILKSLVLPGLRAFTIIDDKKITQDDYDNNFFLCCDDPIGKSRAKVAADNLSEMNEDVKCAKAVEESFETLLEQNQDYFKQFTIVIACGIESSRSISLLSETLWKNSIPLLLVKSVGFFGYIRLQIQEHCVVEAKSDDYREDYRISEIFPDLKDYIEQLPSFDDMSRQELIKVPSLAIIYRSMKQWMEKNNRKDVPVTYKEKDQLRSMIRDQMYHYNDSKTTVLHFESDDHQIHDQTIIAGDMENFLEADKFVNKVFTNAHKVSDNLAKLLAEVPLLDVLNQDKNISNFWLLMSVLKQFIQNYGCLPLSGSIGDMNCGSEHYISLLNIYKKKAQEDVNTMLKMLQEHCPTSTISELEVQSFCKNANYLSVIRTSSIFNEFQANSELCKQIIDPSFNEPNDSNEELHIYIALKLSERFYSKHSRYVGQFDVENDIFELKRELKDLNASLNSNVLLKDEFIEELCRYGGCELHAISSFIGACASHEAIKLISSQYIPIQSTFVYNGTASRTSVYDL